jgi:hypothetical protein
MTTHPKGIIPKNISVDFKKTKSLDPLPRKTRNKKNKKACTHVSKDPRTFGMKYEGSFSTMNLAEFSQETRYTFSGLAYEFCF